MKGARKGPGGHRRRTETTRWGQGSRTRSRAPGDLRLLLRELEAQNEELRKAQVELAAARDRYTNLYELAPVAHLSLDDAGTIREANQTACAVFGMERRRLVGRRLALFLLPQDRPVLARHLAEACDSATAQTCELRLRPKRGASRVVRLDTIVADRSPGGECSCRAAVTDITEQTRAAEKLQAEQATVQRSQSALRQLSRRLMSAQEEERRQIAADLHDDIGPRLHSLQLEVELLGRGLSASSSPLSADADTIRRHLEETAANLEGIVRRLHPRIVHDLGLPVALRAHTEQAARLASIPIRFVERNAPRSVAPDVAICAYRVAQEALRNVERHADARAAVVTLAGVRGGLGLCVADEGRGFDIESVHRVPGGLGLVSMEERVRALGGHFRVRSIPGNGTHVHVWLPSGDARP